MNFEGIDWSRISAAKGLHSALLNLATMSRMRSVTSQVQNDYRLNPADRSRLDLEMAMTKREQAHRAFVKRVQHVFRFLIDEYGFELCRMESGPKRFQRIEVDVCYLKAATVGLRVVTEGIHQNTLLQGGRDGGWRERGLHQVMSLRCSKLKLPHSSSEPGLTNDLLFCAELIRGHFADFLNGDPSILYEPLE